MIRIWVAITRYRDRRREPMAVTPPGEEFSVETRIDSPSHFLIKIESFSWLTHNGIHEYESRAFAAGDYNWRLLIYPDGHQSDSHQGEYNGDHISVYLAMAGTSYQPADWEVKAIFTIFLYNHILDNYVCFRGNLCRFHSSKSKWGFSKMISKDSFMDPSNGYLVDDNCVVGAEVFVIKSQRIFECLSVQKGAYQEKHKFEILYFSRLPQVWQSEVFIAADLSWLILMFPRGNEFSRGQSLSIFVYCLNIVPHLKVRANFSICIKNLLDDDNSICYDASHWFSSAAPNLGWDTFAPVADIHDPQKGFVVEDRCVVEVEITLKAIASDAASHMF